MGAPDPDVTAFLGGLAHARRDEVVVVRDAILASDAAITERIKWNAPSFCFSGQDRVTFRLQPKDRVQLVFHRGAQVRADAFAFQDDAGLIAWATPDRGVVDFRDAGDVDAKLPAVVELVGRWMRATA